jgi:hypothetical protein
MKRPQPATYALQALQPLIDKLSALEQRALQGDALSVVAMSAELSDALRATGRGAMERLLDQAARAQVAAPCECGAEAGSKGFEHTFFIGRFGHVPVSRRRMDCDCGRSWFAFDEAWAIPAGDYADDVREATDRLSCRLGFDEAVAELRQFWGVAPDATTAHRWVGQDGARAAESVRTDAERHWRRYEEQEYAVAAGRCRPAQRSPGFGVVELDGVHALTWKPGLEPRRKAAQPPAPCGPAAKTIQVPDAASETGQAVSRHQPPSALSTVPGSPMGPTARSPRVHGREVCVGLAYHGDDACQESPSRGVILEKRYVATLNDREHFWTQLHAAAATQGVLNAQTVVRVSDGGAYFIDYSDELFRDQPLVGILDIQHANQHVWEAGHQVIANPKKTPAWVVPLTQLIADGRVNDVIATLPAQRQHRRGRKSRTAIDKLDGYLSRHKHLMDYPRYKAAGYPIASAAIESTNKRLVGRRCKQGGMLWSEPGLESIVALRLAFYNPGAWQNLWPHAAVPAPS